MHDSCHRSIPAEQYAWDAGWDPRKDRTDEEHYAQRWTRVAHFDSVGRRSLWVRASAGRLEMRSGREGDDDFAVLEEGQALDREAIRHVLSVLETLRFAHEMDGPLTPVFAYRAEGVIRKLERRLVLARIRISDLRSRLLNVLRAYAVVTEPAHRATWERIKGR